MNLPPIVINIFGAPGAGKSTTAATNAPILKTPLTSSAKIKFKWHP